jgi:DNA-binding winged helix-turn-helix (wHTH) protein
MNCSIRCTYQPHVLLSVCLKDWYGCLCGVFLLRFGGYPKASFLLPLSLDWRQFYLTRNSTVSKHGVNVLNLDQEQSTTDYAENAVLRFGDLVISIPARSVQVVGQLVPLTAKEFDLLVTLASAPGHVFTRTALLKQVWNYSYLGKSRTVDVHIATLRRKLEMFTNASCSIQTVWGKGYQFLSLSAASSYDAEKRHVLSEN